MDGDIIQEIHPNPNIPQLPTEVWRRVISYVVRLTGSASTELDDPFGPPHVDEEYPDADPGIFDDRRSLLSVCLSWREMVIELTAEYITIFSQRELLHIISVFEASAKRKKKKGGKALGDWTTRVDFKILGSYCATDVGRLLQLIPNLLIFVNKNGSSHYVERKTPHEVIEAIVKHCGHSLRRIEWNGPGEPPTYHDLLYLTRGCPELTTLRLTCIYSYPAPEELVFPLPLPTLSLPKLKTLSLGMIPEPSELNPPDFSVVWDPLLSFLSVGGSCSLPQLERFEIEIFPVPLHPFFVVHGPKIRMFRVTTWSIGQLLPETLEFCPNIESLVFSHGTDEFKLPLSLPKLRRICIVPAVEYAVHVPLKVFNYAVLLPLDRLLMTVEEMNAPCLEEIWIRDNGAFVDVLEHPNWLQGWWRRWNIRGVQFMNKIGKSFEHVGDECDALLDRVRT
ncbi:hypothetical protein BDQ17DRAFT_1322739 [Cyathus striatus]|nr:hypothetical protein BDQ17DRAFT_1322739 [Cyathus striatus]